MTGFILALEECMQHPVLQRQNEIIPWISKTLLHPRASLQVWKQCSSFLSLWSSFLQFQTFLFPLCAHWSPWCSAARSGWPFSHTGFSFLQWCVVCLSWAVSPSLWSSWWQPIPFKSHSCHFLFKSAWYLHPIKSSAACRLLLCFIKCSCFPDTWWDYYGLMRWAALWDQMWCFHLPLILSEFVQCSRPKLGCACPVLHGAVGIECSPLVQDNVLALWPLLLSSFGIKVSWLCGYLVVQVDCHWWMSLDK